MLLSQAMAEGLFHPRCRHGLGTYYPEIEDIVHYETEDNKLNEYGTEELNRAHIENMIQKYKRLTIGSLDPDNIAKYQVKLNEWEGRKAQLGIANSENSGIIEADKIFTTTDDPMREIFGDGLTSNPDEIERIIVDLQRANVKIEHRDNVMCYQPGLSKGTPGKLIIDKKASYSAWLHEYTHFLDDKKDGFIGMRVFENNAKCIEREMRAYNAEIKLAKKHNRPDMVKRLEELKKKEVSKYEHTTDD